MGLSRSLRRREGSLQRLSATKVVPETLAVCDHAMLHTAIQTTRGKPAGGRTSAELPISTLQATTRLRVVQYAYDCCMLVRDLDTLMHLIVGCDPLLYLTSRCESATMRRLPPRDPSCVCGETAGKDNDAWFLLPPSRVAS